ncbi:MAG: PspA/IM30 family protein [Planctomycetota bacterium]|jgi:chromosome segregation ATPase
MKKLILIGIGLGCAVAFIGFDAVGAFVDKTRSEVRSKLISPEVELQAQISEARDLAEKCRESVVQGDTALTRLDVIIRDRRRDLDRRAKVLQVDRGVLQTRRALLQEQRGVYLIGNEEYSWRTLNRDALLRARAFGTDQEIHQHLSDTLEELKMQRAQTAAEIEEAKVEEQRLENEITALHAELENLKARRAVAQTREEAGYIFDRSTFDEARDKVAEIRTTIALHNKRLDYYGRNHGPRKGLIPAHVETPEAVESGVDAITAVLGVESGNGKVEAETLPTTLTR